MKGLTPHHISITLRAICYEHPLPTTPLFRFKCIPFEMYDHISSEVAMTDWLVSLICQQLNSQRTIHHLSLLTPHTPQQETQATFAQAFTLNTPYLQAWMVLYSRVVRNDLNFSMMQLSKLSKFHPCILHRRQQLGIHCLYAHIVRLERDQ